MSMLPIKNVKAYPVEGGGLLLTNLALLPYCKLAKMQTADGRWKYIKGRAFVGKAYQYAPRSRAVQTFTHQPTGEDFRCEVVFVYDDSDQSFHPMPTECLSFAHES